MESNETDDIEMEGAVEEETMEGKEGEVATKVQGAKLLLHHPSPQVAELQRVERELGRQLSKEEHEFVDAQLQMRGIQSIKAANRSDEQSMRLKKLQNFINHAKKRPSIHHKEGSCSDHCPKEGGGQGEVGDAGAEGGEQGEEGGGQGWRPLRGQEEGC